MITFPPGVSNRLWLLRSLEPWRAFQAAAQDPRGAQLRRLRSILRWNADSEYGARHGFESIRTAEEYRRRVPMVRYDDLAEEMGAVRGGREGVLTSEPTLLLHPSSGSTAATKLIPYTASLRRELGRAVSVWIGDLFWSRPQLMDGPAYWSISPLPMEADGQPGSGTGSGTGAGSGPASGPTSDSVGAPGLPRVRDGGEPALGPGPVRVGFDDDAAYLGGLTRSVVSGALAVPGEVGKISDPVAHRYATLRYLLGAPEVRIFSVWSPTFLALLLEPLARWWDRLVEDVEAGTLSMPGAGAPLDTNGASSASSGGVAGPMGRGVQREEGREGPGLSGIGLRLPSPDPRRARELRAVGPHDLPGIWPRLGLLSAWADGASAPYAADLRRDFPGVPFQPKGLIATEAFVTIPRWGLPGAHPAITSHFLEFLPEGADSGDETLLVDEVVEGGRYEVLVTTGGGLYRYRLGDLVEVMGVAEGLPCLRFVGRADRISDRFGEKLSDGFVTRALRDLCVGEDLDPGFSLLAPEEGEDGTTRYVWYVSPGGEAGGRCPDGHDSMGVTGGVPVGIHRRGAGNGDGFGRLRGAALHALSRKLDLVLSENFHYAHCRRLGQLATAELRVVPPSAPLRYLERKGMEGGRLGDVKIPALETESGWGDVLRGSGEVLRGSGPGSRPSSAGRRQSLPEAPAAPA